jgi:hypothetical protein
MKGEVWSVIAPFAAIAHADPCDGRGSAAGETSLVVPLRGLNGMRNLLHVTYEDGDTQDSLRMNQYSQSCIIDSREIPNL